MFDVSHTAQNVANEWPAVIGKLPRNLAEAIAVYDATSYVDDPYTAVDASKITADNAAEAIHDLAQALAAQAKFADAKLSVRRALAFDILRFAGAAVPELIEAIRPAFDKAASDFTEDVQLLPDQVSHDTLVNGGPDVLAAYHSAVAANQVIAKFDRWLADLIQLHAFAGRTPEVARVLKPTTRGQLQTLLGANRQDYLALNPLYVTAVRAGIEFGLCDPHEAGRLREEIEAQPVERKQAQFMQIGGSPFSS
jgi:hypothetical protein